MQMDLEEPISGRPAVQQSFRTVLALTGLITFSAVIRLYLRCARRAPLRIEDGLSCISVLSYYGMAAAFFYLLYFCGMGNHLYELQPRQLSRFIQTILGVQALYSIALSASKLSLLWVLRRLFVVQPFKNLNWTIIVLQASWMTMTALMGLLLCSPIQKNWDLTVEGKCGDQIAAYMAIGVISLIIDVAMFVLPLPVIFTMMLKEPLRVRRPYRAALFAMSGVGLVSIIFAVARLRSLQSLDLSDFSYTIPKAITWIYAETGIVILVAGTATLRSAHAQASQAPTSAIRISGSKSTVDVKDKATKGGAVANGEP